MARKPRDVDFETFRDYVAKNFSKHEKKRYGHANWRNLALASLGFAGEAGEVTDHFKKVLRNFNGDPKKYPPKKRRELLLEFGDSFHYFTYLLQRAGFTLGEVMAENIVKLDRRHGRSPVRTKHKGAKRARRA